MVDNEEQWEDEEYSEEEEQDEDYSSDDDSDEDIDNEYSDDEEYEDDDGEYGEDDEEDDEDNTRPRSSSKNNGARALMLIIPLLLILIAGLCVLPKFLGGNKEVASETAKTETTIEQENDMFAAGEGNESVASGQSEGFDDSFFEAGNADNNTSQVNFDNVTGEMNVQSADGNGAVATITQNAPETKTSETDLFGSNASVSEKSDQGNDAIMVAFNKANRENPFKPLYSKEELSAKAVVPKFEVIDNAQFEIIEPPKVSVEDPNLTRLLQTQISGILYDDVSPSAVVNLNGIDSFVKIGDVVAGYRIDGITRNKVQISYNNNTYVASVGELFTRGTLEKHSAVENLENKFAGRYKNK